MLGMIEVAYLNKPIKLKTENIGKKLVMDTALLTTQSLNFTYQTK